MKAVIVYESMYGNTHKIATAIAEGLGSALDVVIVPVSAASGDMVDHADLLVVGGPTHVHGMSRPVTRAGAVEAVEKPDNDLELEPDPEGTGLREWFDQLEKIDVLAAAFDTRVSAPAVVTGRASKGIARRLRHHGASLVGDPESFLVTKATHLEPEEEDRACEWGRELARLVAERRPTTTPAT
jgi:hypothetical protein